MASVSKRAIPDFDLLRSGKSAGSESFPVASLVLSPRVRPHVLAYYGFVRTADDVADHPDLSSERKLALLDILEEEMENPASDVKVCASFARSVQRTGIGLDHAQTMLSAFRRDAKGDPIETWSDLEAYCQLSAAPAGRFLLEIHGEGKEYHPAADGMCAILQITNHVQDVKKDWAEMKRCYIPNTWIDELNITHDDLTGSAMTAGLKTALHRMLDGCKPLYEAGIPMLPHLKDRSLKAQVHGVAYAAQKLASHLYGRDPLAERVDLSTSEKAGMAAACLFRRAPSPWPR